MRGSLVETGDSASKMLNGERSKVTEFQIRSENPQAPEEDDPGKRDEKRNDRGDKRLFRRLPLRGRRVQQVKIGKQVNQRDGDENAADAKTNRHQEGSGG